MAPVARREHFSSRQAAFERLLFGEVIAGGAPLSDYAIRVYLSTEVVFDRALPGHELSAGEMDSVGDGVGETVGRNGGTFVVAAPGSDVYLLGVRVRGTALIRTVRFLATPARIAASAAKCSYIGSFVIRPPANGIDVQVRDDLEGALTRSPDTVKGCQPSRAIAQRIEDSAMVHNALPHSRPAEVGPVDVCEHSALYQLHGTTAQALQRGIHDRGLSGDTAGLTEARLTAKTSPQLRRPMRADDS